MKNFLYYTFLILALAGIYFYNNPIVDFKADKAEGIHFQRGDWNQALSLARKENKLIFLDIYATWCGPCKKLKSHSFSNNRVGSFFNTHFINVSMDGEKGEGAMLSAQYNLNSYPSLYFIDGTGKVVSYSGGYQSSDELLDLGKSISAVH